jgi:hypothetical protein
VYQILTIRSLRLLFPSKNHSTYLHTVCSKPHLGGRNAHVHQLSVVYTGVRTFSLLLDQYTHVIRIAESQQQTEVRSQKIRCTKARNARRASRSLSSSHSIQSNPTSKIVDTQDANAMPGPSSDGTYITCVYRASFVLIYPCIVNGESESQTQPEDSQTQPEDSQTQPEDSQFLSTAEEREAIIQQLSPVFRFNWEEIDTEALRRIHKSLAATQTAPNATQEQCPEVSHHLILI